MDSKSQLQQLSEEASEAKKRASQEEGFAQSPRLKPPDTKKTRSTEHHGICEEEESESEEEYMEVASSLGPAGEELISKMSEVIGEVRTNTRKTEMRLNEVADATFMN